MRTKGKRKATSVIAAVLLVILASMTALTQDVVDRTVAVVTDASRKPQLITYSDLMWQLALQRGVPLDNPSSQDLNQALQTLIDQRIFALEAERLPRPAPDKAEIDAEIARILTHIPPAVFQARLRQVGFDSVSDPAFEKLIARRLAIEKYIDFRFRSFVVVTADEEARYYRDVFTPEWRRKTPERVLQPLEVEREGIRKELKEQKVAAAIERFLDEAKRRVQVEILFPV